MGNILRLIATLIFLASQSAYAATPEAGMVVAAHPLAAEAGIEMLNHGGNAFDAAAATALALGVVEPGSSGIGGGGFFLLYIAKENRYVMIDARETSPTLAGQGKVYQNISSIDGPAAAGVPGLAAGVDHLVANYGRLSRKQVVSPAAKLARDGFVVSPRLAGMIRFRRQAFNDSAHAIFDKNEGDIIRQPVLAETLERFALKGRKGFYRGQIAGRLAADMKRDGGLIREGDLADYRVKEREPVSFNYQGHRFVSASLPSSGGMTLAMVFGMLKNDNLKALKKADRIHLLTEAMKRAYRDRNRYLGDADHISIPDDYLDQARLAELRGTVDMRRATPSLDLQGVGEMSGSGADTSHFSIIDHEGNMVSATLSINYPFGSGYVSPATGILLNDEMDDFAVIPGEANAYGLVQGQANGVDPGKRMLSSMTPTFVTGPDRTFIVGTPGGSRIISMVLLTSLGFMMNESGPAPWVDAPRFHHQFLPDNIQHEKGAFSEAIAAELKKRGHVLKEVRSYGNMQAIMLDHKTGRLTGIVDQRGEGRAVSTSRGAK
ncbi:MAG: gamma-glutamyltransferase [Mariprofundaceae bacterium]|nr:gamma-glutamyltransferase [Mariprofundaceae bacterium]